MKSRKLLRAPVFQAVRGAEDVLQIIWENIPPRVNMAQYLTAVERARGPSRLAFDRVLSQLPSPEKYLRENIEGYSWAPAVLRSGKEYFAEDTGEKWEMLEHARCFNNAMKVCRESNGRIKYVEGLTIAPFGIMLHAWNLKKGKVIDRTWPMAHLNRYFGVVFSLEWLEHIKISECGCVFGRWDETFSYVQRTARR